MNVTTLDLDLLLARPDLVQPVAPWCTVLSNLELALVMAAQSGLGGESLRRAELERRVQAMVAGLGVGPMYFQRTSRAVNSLEQRGILLTEGNGRTRRFRIAPQGFAALILNLRVLRSDPTVDGSEFELKRSVVALWNAVHQELLEMNPDLGEASLFDEFFDELEHVVIWGQQVVTDEVVAEAFDVLALIDLQRVHVGELRSNAALRLEDSRATEQLLENASSEVSRLLATSQESENLNQAEIVQAVAAAASAPRVEEQVAIARYDAYLSYLERIRVVYEADLKTVDLNHLRERRGQK
ncbi:MAG: hypothetical protein GY906_36085 [bacterium]|nr:hypothetical protein [bacterium]